MIEELFVPGFVSIITDATGIMLIALTPIKIMQMITIVCTFWSIVTVLIVMCMLPAVLSYLSFPQKSVARLAKKSRLDSALQRLGAWIARWGCWPVLAVFLVHVHFRHLPCPDHPGGGRGSRLLAALALAPLQPGRVPDLLQPCPS